jgi:hypothetical protein
MIRISSDQWASMGRARFDERMISIIRAFHPDLCASLDDGELAAMIHEQAAKATHYGLADERSAASYVYAAWLMGEEFDTRIPAVAQVLGSPALDAENKARALDDFAVAVFSALAAADGGGAS